MFAISASSSLWWGSFCSAATEAAEAVEAVEAAYSSSSPSPVRSPSPSSSPHRLYTQVRPRTVAPPLLLVHRPTSRRLSLSASTLLGLRASPQRANANAPTKMEAIRRPSPIAVNVVHFVSKNSSGLRDSPCCST